MLGLYEVALFAWCGVQRGLDSDQILAALNLFVVDRELTKEDLLTLWTMFSMPSRAASPSGKGANDLVDIPDGDPRASLWLGPSLPKDLV